MNSLGKEIYFTIDLFFDPLFVGLVLKFVPVLFLKYPSDSPKPVEFPLSNKKSSWIELSPALAIEFCKLSVWVLEEANFSDL